jgi:hypothetical protein
MKNKICTVLRSLLVVLAGAVVSPHLVAAAPQRQLLQRAKKVAALTAWHEGFGTSFGADRPGNSYYWINATQLLIFRFKGISQRRDTWAISRRDSNSGQETPLPALTEHFNQFPGPHSWAAISPDGQWLLWIGLGYCAAQLNGSGFHRWEGAADSSTVSAKWLGDSRHWVEEITDNDGRIKSLVQHDLDDVKKAIRIKLPRVDPLHIRSDSSWGMPVVTWDRHYLAFGSQWPASSSLLRVVRIGFGEHARARISTIHAPESWLFAGAWSYRSDNETTLSLRGDRIAGVCQPRSRKRINKSMQLVAIWVSSINGRGMHQIGVIQTNTNDQAPWLYDLRWLPDGKHLSFVYRGALYTVAAD